MARIGLAFLSVIISIAGTAQSVKKAATTYRNPVIAGDFADPSVIRVGNTYYAVGTSSEWGPVHPIYTSTDLVNWTYAGPVFDTLPAWTMGSFWAPELFYRNGTFYVYYTARRKTDKRSFIGVASTRNIRKGFTDHGLLIEWTTEAIDAFVLEAGGSLYITWKAYGLDKGKIIELLGAELEPDGLKVKGEAFMLLRADTSGWEGGGIEGQAIIKRGRYYYMLYSGNACCGLGCNYQVGVARAETVRGPWQRFQGNPLLVGGDAWKCPGHGTVVTTPQGRYFYLHHAYSGTDFTFIGRQGVLTELVWNEKTGWPYFRYGNTMPAEARAPITGNSNNRNLSVDFSKPHSPVSWVWDVSRPRPEYAVQEGLLQLKNNTDSTGFLGVVLKGGTFLFSATVQPQAGLLQSICLYGDAANALGLGVRSGAVELWQVKDGVRSVLQTQALADTAQLVTLQLASRSGRLFSFGWALGDGAVNPLNGTPPDGSFLPRWDRAPRAGIQLRGDAHARSRVKNISINYE